MAAYSGYRSKADLLGMVTKPFIKANVVKHCTLRIEYESGDVAIRYQDTDVVTWTKAGNIVLDSGGYRTQTTKARMNENLQKIQVHQDHSVWYVTKTGEWERDKWLVFFDGIMFRARDGKCISKPIDPDLHRKQVAAMKKRINNFVRKLDRMYEIPAPAMSDCWHCSMKVASGPDKGKTMGDVANSNHLLTHVLEGYMHGSLIKNALDEAGYRDPAFLVKWRHLDIIKRALRRYLYKRLLP